MEAVIESRGSGGATSDGATPRSARGVRRRIADVLLGAAGGLLGARGSFKRDAAVSMLAGVAARAITLASLPLVAMIYAPAELGVWAIILALSSYLVPVATTRYDVAVVIAPSDRMARGLVLAVGGIAVLVAALLLTATWLMPVSFWAAVSGLEPARHIMLAWIPVLLLLLAVQTMLQAMLTRKRAFAALGIAQLLQALVTAVATIWLGAASAASSASIALGAALGFAFSAGLMAVHLGADLTVRPDTRLATTAVAAMRRYSVYPGYLLPYSLSSGLAERVLQIVLGGAYSMSTLGAFFLARQLMMSPVTLLAGTLKQVMFAHSAQVSDPARRNARVVDGLRLLVDGVGPAVAFGLFWLIPLMGLLLPAAWTAAGPFAWWTLFPAAMIALTGWLDRMLDVLGRQRLSVVLQVASDLVLIAVVLASPWLGLSALQMVALLSVTIAVYNVVWLGIILHLLRIGSAQGLALAARAAGLVVGWGACQWALAQALPRGYGMLAGALLLAAALVPAARRLASGSRRE